MDVKAAPQDKWTEDLLWQAARGVELGRAYCTCPASYHELWSPLRAAGFVSPGASEFTKISSVVSPWIKRSTRLLIGGSADPGILCAIGRMAGERIPDITVIDRCRAPLELILEYASHRQVPCRTIHSDILDLDGSERWDLIFLHYTPIFVERRLQGVFFERLKHALARDGVIVCVTRTGKATENKDLDRLEEAFLAEAKNSLEASGISLPWEHAKLRQLLEGYALERVSRRLNYPTRDELEAAISGSGLCVVSKTSAGLERVIADSKSEKVDSQSSWIFVASHSDT